MKERHIKVAMTAV